MKILGLALAATLALVAGRAVAADAKAETVAAAKAGDTAYVCGCGKGCSCGTIQAGPGKCHCGKELEKATVTKVDGDKVSVKLASGAEQTLKAPYKCGCGGGCNCTPAALAPGKCKCGKDLVPNK